MRRYSSAQTVAALKRLGFEKQRQKGSHATYARRREDGTVDGVCVVPMAKAEIPDGTLKQILAMAHVTESEFLASVR